MGWTEVLLITVVEAVAGYSGGNASDGTGGNGGTSYINPSLVKEISRGYATVAEDSDRNLTNPWTAYGFIEIELGRPETKLILAKDEEGFKYFDGEDNIDGTKNATFTNQWKLIPGVNTESDLTEHIYAQYGLPIITNKDNLQDKVKFLVASTEPDEVISVGGNVNQAIIEQVKDVSISDVSEILSMTSTDNLTNIDVRFAVSKNSGKSWQTYGVGSWVDIDITDRVTFAGVGYNLSQFSTIPVADWNSYGAKTIRFSFIITQNSFNGSTIIDNISIVSNLVGSWKHFKESEASYEYISDSEFKVTFNEGGNYKVNYLDSLNPSVSS